LEESLKYKYRDEEEFDRVRKEIARLQSEREELVSDPQGRPTHHYFLNSCQSSLLNKQAHIMHNVLMANAQCIYTDIKWCNRPQHFGTKEEVICSQRSKKRG